MKKIIFRIIPVLFILHIAAAAFAEKPLLGIGGISVNSPRAMRLSLIFEERLIAVIGQSAHFIMLNPRMLKSELIKFNCLEEKCMLRFAAGSGLGLFIAGDIDDRGDEIIVNISGYGMKYPFNGKRMYHYMVSVSVSNSLSEREYAYIFEEHAVRFFAGCLKRYKSPAAFTIADGILSINGKSAPDGSYLIYRQKDNETGALAAYSEAGRIDVKKGKIVVLDYTQAAGGDFVLAESRAEGVMLEDSFYRQKRELVFSNLSWDEKLYMALFMPLGSASMPIVSPFMGYFASADWPGLALWSVNALPYISLEAVGFVKRPSSYRDDKRDVPRSSYANYYFAWYMLFSGGGSLFVDAFASPYIKNASMYIGGAQPYMGSDFITGYLALTTPGGGHFYKGYRLWGYTYFHASNLLVYGMLWQFSPKERLGGGGRYHKERASKKTGYALAGVLGALKVTEFIHALILPYNIKNGTELASDEPFSFEPALFAGVDDDVSLGLRFSFSL